MAATSHSITLSDDLWRRLERLAACEGVTPERVVERVLVAASEALVAPSADATSAHVPSAHVPSALERAAGLIGSVEGPADLSMREGFGA